MGRDKALSFVIQSGARRLGRGKGMGLQGLGMVTEGLEEVPGGAFSF